MPAELYDPPTLWQIAAHNPWLSVSPVSEYNGDPAWAADVNGAARSARAPDRPTTRCGP